MGQIYIIKNLVNEKVYIGLTTRNFEYRYGKNGIKSVYSKNKKHNSHLASAIKKYGFGCWSINILEDDINDNEELKRLETHYIYLYKSSDPKRGYNKTDGGDSIANSAKREVICLNDMKVFKSLADAGEYYGISYTAISAICRREVQQIFGLQFDYYEGSHKEYVMRSITNDCFTPVICVDTGEIFETITAAALKYNVNATAIDTACKNHYKGAACCNLQWDYYEGPDKEYKLMDKQPFNNKPVICIDIGVIYESISEAERITGLQGIGAACRGDCHTIGGYQWAYYEEGVVYEVQDIKYKDTNWKKVICIETQKVYDSISIAERETEATNVSLVVLKERETSGGYHWDYYEEGKFYDLNDYIQERIAYNQRKVICINTGKVYKSITEATNATGANNISKVCNGKSFDTKGLQFAYYEEGKEYALKEKPKRRPNMKQLINPKTREVEYIPKKPNKPQKRKKVICLDTQVIYENSDRAAAAVGVKGSSIISAINGQSKTSGDMQWAYYEGPDKDYAPQKIVKERAGKAPKKVLCVETGIIYESLSKADKATGISFKNISSVCNSKRAKAGGFTWKYI